MPTSYDAPDRELLHEQGQSTESVDYHLVPRKGMPSWSKFRRSAARVHRHRTALGFAQFRCSSEFRPETADHRVRFLCVSPSVGSRAKLHAQVFQMIHSFACSLAIASLPHCATDISTLRTSFPAPIECLSNHSPQATTIASPRQSSLTEDSQVLHRAGQLCPVSRRQSRPPCPHRASTAPDEVLVDRSTSRTLRHPR